MHVNGEFFPPSSSGTISELQKVRDRLFSFLILSCLVTHAVKCYGSSFPCINTCRFNGNW